MAVGGVEHLHGAAGKVDRGDAPGVAAFADGGAERRLPGARVDALRLGGEQVAQHVEVVDGAVEQQHLVVLHEVVAALGALEREPAEVRHAQLPQERLSQSAGAEQIEGRLDVREVAVLLGHRELDAGSGAGGDHPQRLFAGERHRLLHQHVRARGRASEHDVEPLVGGGGAHRNEVEALGVEHGAEVGVGAPEAELALERARRGLVDVTACRQLEQVAVGAHVAARDSAAPDQSVSERSESFRHAGLAGSLRSRRRQPRLCW